MKPVNFPYKKILIFLGLTFFITALFDIPYVILKPSGNASRLFTTAAMWSPGLAAIITKLLFREKLSELGWKWKPTKLLLWAFIVPILISVIAYLVIWIFGWGEFYNSEFVKGTAASYGITSLSPFWVIFIFVIFTGTFGLIGKYSRALGEEIGWRGFLTPELYKKFGFIKTSFFVGVIWAVWHYTVLILGDYNNGITPLLFQLTCFTISVIAASFIYTYFTIKSGSLFPAMILHGTHNLYIQSILTPLTKSNSYTPWFIDEFGVVLPIVTIIFAIYFIIKGKNLTPIDMK